MNVSKRKPEITIFAGPNGSGKSTITELLRPNYDYINADEIDYWDIEDIKALTGITKIQKKDLNSKCIPR